MLRHRTPALATTLPLVLLGSLPLDSVAGEFFFPVLEASGSHWFSWFDPHYLQRTAAHSANRTPLPEAARPRRGARNDSLMPEQDPVLHDAYDAYDDSQIDVLGQMASIYREQGRYADAFDQLERRYFLSRVTLGLHDARHVPLLEELVTLAELKGDPQRAYELRRALLNLQLRVYDESELRHTEALLAWAEYHLQRFLADSADSLRLANLAADLRLHPDFLESDQHFLRALRKLAADLPPAADHRIALLLAMRKWQTLHLAAFRRQRLQTGFQQHETLTSAHESVQQLTPATYFGAVMQLLRPAAEIATAATGQERELLALQLLQVADWQHAIGLHGASRRTFDEAAALLRDAELPAARIAELLSPGLPLPDPEHWYHFHSQPAAFRGHLDAEITVDSWGQVTDVRLSDPQARDTRLGQALLQHIAGSDFRPLPGTDATEKAIRVRYYHE